MEASEIPAGRRHVVASLTIALLASVLAIAALLGGRALNLVGHRSTNALVVVAPDGLLTTIDDSGALRGRAPADGRTYLFPAWSPDGRRIAAIGSSQATGDGIYVFDAPDGSIAARQPAELYASRDHRPFYLYWSPEGSQLAFLTSEPDGLALRVMSSSPAASKAEPVVLREGSPLYWTWSRPGRVLVHSGANNQDAFVGEIGVDGSAPTSTLSAIGPFRAPGVSGDGRHRAYEAQAIDGTMSIVVGPTDGAGAHEVRVWGQAALAFAPVGANVAFLAATNAFEAQPFPLGPLRVVNAETGATRTLLDGPVVAFFWAPDGRTIASLRVRTGGAPSARGPSTAATAALARAGQLAAEPPVPAQVTGFELELVFTNVANGSIRSARNVAVSELFTTQVIPFFDQYSLSHRIWSADSRSIVLPVVVDGASHILVVPADGTDPQDVGEGAVAFWSP